MATRLTLICHAATRSMREGSFPTVEEALDAGGVQKAGKTVAQAEQVISAPELAARQTAEALGSGMAIDPALSDMNYGEWAGRRFADVHAADPEAFTAWMSDPTQPVPGGEGYAPMLARLTPWLATQTHREEQVVAVASPSVIRGIMALSLDMPLAVALRIDIAPLSAVILSYNRLWRLQAIQPA